MNLASAAATIAFLLGSPAIAGVQPTMEAAAQFHVGSSTVADVEAAFGRPTTDEVNSDGEHKIAYTVTHAHAKAASFVPIIGLFAGGATGESSTVIFVFDKDGLLKSYASQTSHIDCGSPITGVKCK